MKQGPSKSSSSAHKTEPKSHAVSVDHVANIGLQQVRTRPAPPLYKAEGYKAPGAVTTHHPSGSQGKR